MVFDDTLKDFCRYWLVTEKYSPEQIRVKGIEQFGINSGDVDPPFRFMLTHLLAGNNCKN
jgi:hypothetical protein